MSLSDAKEKKSEYPLRNVKMIVEYDGTDYVGWQRQINGISIQEILERKISEHTCAKVNVIGSGRTDAGVHALAQVFNVIAPFPTDNERLVRILNSRLPKDIVIKSAETVDMRFHSNFNAKWKRYRYFVHNCETPSAWTARTSWFMPVKLDMDRIRAAAALIVGERDFSAFMGHHSSVKTTVRNLFSVDVSKTDEGMIIFEVVGSGFLRHMIRIIAGTLVDIGRGRLEVEDMTAILNSKDRKTAGPTAPARGLFLVEVGYE